MVKKYVASNRRDVAEFFGVKVVNIDRWRENGMPTRGRGKGYDLKEITRWKIEGLEKRVDPEQEIRLEMARLKLAELQEARGLVLRVEDHNRIVLGLCSLFSNNLMASVPKVSARVRGLEDNARRAAVKKLFLEILEELVEEVGTNSTSNGTTKAKTPARR